MVCLAIQPGLAQDEPRLDRIAQAQSGLAPRAPSAAASGEAGLVARANEWTVGLAGGTPSGTFMRFAAEIARNVNQAGEARVLAGLVAEGAASARRGGFERVLFPHFDARTARLYGELGLLRGPAWAKREYVKGPRPLLDGLTPDRTYFVRAQGDYGL